jgi:carbohydrate kinase (thermoresistant glucokinase family)
MNTRALLVMGVSGSGKSTVGKALAQALGWVFADADDYHSESNRAKLTRGEPLTDADREPWLLRLHGLLEQHLQTNQPLVLACSALKERHREILTQNLEGIQVVFLSGSRELIAERMRQRTHFMPVSLLESQLQTLEPPTQAITVDIGKPLEGIVEEVLVQLSV